MQLNRFSFKNPFALNRFDFTDLINEIQHLSTLPDLLTDTTSGIEIYISNGVQKEWLIDVLTHFNEMDNVKESDLSIVLFQDKETSEKRHIEEKKAFHDHIDCNGKKILEIGCGIGRWVETLHDKCDSYLGIDYTDDMINIANETIDYDNCKFQVMSATDICDDELLNKASPNPELLHLGLSGRVYNAVCRAGIQSITELEEMLDSGEFAKKRGVGQKMVDEAKKAIEMYKEIL